MPLTRPMFQAAVSCPDTAADVVSQLDELAKWIVRQDYRRKAADRLKRPDLNGPPSIDRAQRQPGGCLVVMVSGLGDSSILDDGFLLPLHWRRGREHDDRLPPLLRQTADLVMSALVESGYSLHLMLPGQAGPKEAFLPDANSDLGFESAFPALACGLLMFIEGHNPDYHTACTGSWENGISTVGHLEQKTKAVFEFPRGGMEKEIRNWFVPAGTNAHEAEKTLKDLISAGSTSHVMLRTFDPIPGDLRRALGPLLASSGLTPAADADFPVLQAYYQWLREKSPSDADDYYHGHLYQQICQRALAHPGPLTPRPTHFVSVVSSPALVGLADELFRFERMLILHTSAEDARGTGVRHPLDFSEKARRARGLVESGEDKCRIGPFVFRANLPGTALRRDIVAEMAKHIGPFLEGVPHGEVMWDTTSGLRLFSHALEKCFARPGDWMLNLNHQWSAHTDQRIPFTETMLVWKHGEDWD